MKALNGFFSVLVLFLIPYRPVMGQENFEKKEFFKVDQVPEFPGGIEKLKQLITENVFYPGEAKKEGIQGKVIISFTVNKNGEVVDAEVAQGVHAILDEEALRIIESMPVWNPGRKDGNPVNVRITLPVQFNLDSAPKE